MFYILAKFGILYMNIKIYRFQNKWLCSKLKSESQHDNSIGWGDTCELCPQLPFIVSVMVFWVPNPEVDILLCMTQSQNPQISLISGPGDVYTQCFMSYDPAFVDLSRKTWLFPM